MKKGLIVGILMGMGLLGVMAVNLTENPLVEVGHFQDVVTKSTPVVDVRAFGATGDGATNDSAAIQAAIDAASATPYGVVFFPPGTYRIDTGLEVSANYVILRGSGKVRTKLLAGAAMTAMLDYTGTSQIMCEVHDLGFDCEDVADYAIRALDRSYVTVRNCILWEAATSGIYLKESWCSRIENTLITEGVDGIQLGAYCNGVQITGCRIYLNSGRGINLTGTDGSSSGVTIDGCVIEKNAMTGIYAWYQRNLNIRNSYFETNAATGWEVTVPVTATIQAQIILSGAVPGSGMVATQPCRNVIIDGCYFYTNTATVTDPNAAIWAGCAYDLAVRNCSENSSGSIPILAKYGTHTSGRIDGLEMSGNYSDANDIDVEDGLGTASVDDKYSFTWRIDRCIPRNYFPQNFANWTEEGSHGSTLTRGTGTYRGHPVLDLYDNNGTSNYYQVTFTISDYPEWTVGTHLWFGVWYQYTGADMALSLKTPNGGDMSGYVTGDGTWLFNSRMYRIQSGDTTLTFGFYKIGSTDAHVYLSHPMLCVVGVPYDAVETQPYEFREGLVVKNADTSAGYLDFYEDSDVDATAYVRESIAIVDLSNAQIKDLADTPVELVAAPGAGKWLELCGSSLWLDYGTNALTEADSPDDLAIEYDSGTGPAASASIVASGFITATADTGAFAIPVSLAGTAAASIVNKNLALVNTGADYTGNAGNDTVMRVIVRYRVHSGLGL